jgi:hypothetical protein
MSGEHSVAKQLYIEAITAADKNPSMCPDAQALAILTTVLHQLSKTRSRKDLDSYIAYNLDNRFDSDLVITRGC